MRGLEELVEGLTARMESVSARLSRAMPAPPFMAALAQIENFLGVDIRGRHAAELEQARNDEGTDREELAVRLVKELRDRMESIPLDRPLLSLVARLDAALPVDTVECMDDARLDWKTRSKILKVLDRMTRRAGDYIILGDLVRPWCQPDDRPTFIVDVASGSGGFPIAFARRPDRPKDLRIIASDIGAEYLALGRQAAERAAVTDVVSFRQLDAFRLREQLDGETPDLVTCTRSLHHFGVGGTVRLLAQAVDCARRGVVFIDISRSISRLAMAAAAGFSSGSWRFAHDAAVSVRKAFSVEELRLMAACVPGGDRAEVFFTPPAYAVLRLRTGKEPA